MMGTFYVCFSLMMVFHNGLCRPFYEDADYSNPRYLEALLYEKTETLKAAISLLSQLNLPLLCQSVADDPHAQFATVADLLHFATVVVQAQENDTSSMEEPLKYTTLPTTIPFEKITSVYPKAVTETVSEEEGRPTRPAFSNSKILEDDIKSVEDLTEENGKLLSKQNLVINSVDSVNGENEFQHASLVLDNTSKNIKNQNKTIKNTVGKPIEEKKLTGTPVIEESTYVTMESGNFITELPQAQGPERPDEDHYGRSDQQPSSPTRHYSKPGYTTPLHWLIKDKWPEMERTSKQLLKVDKVISQNLHNGFKGNKTEEMANQTDENVTTGRVESINTKATDTSSPKTPFSQTSTINSATQTTLSRTAEGQNTTTKYPMKLQTSTPDPFVHLSISTKKHSSRTTADKHLKSAILLENNTATTDTNFTSSSVTWSPISVTSVNAVNISKILELTKAAKPSVKATKKFVSVTTDMKSSMKSSSSTAYVSSTISTVNSTLPPRKMKETTKRPTTIVQITSTSASPVSKANQTTPNIVSKETENRNPFSKVTKIGHSTKHNATSFTTTSTQITSKLIRQTPASTPQLTVETSSKTTETATQTKETIARKTVTTQRNIETKSKEEMETSQSQQNSSNTTQTSEMPPTKKFTEIRNAKDKPVLKKDTAFENILVPHEQTQKPTLREKIVPVENSRDTERTDMSDYNNEIIQEKTNDVVAPGQNEDENFGFFTCPTIFGFYPDAINCGQFYICSWSIPYHFDCPVGTVWNIELTVCDWPFNVNCGTRPWYGQTAFEKHFLPSQL